MDVPNSNHPLIASATPSTDTPYPLIDSTLIPSFSSSISSVEDIAAVQSLLGLRAGSDTRLSERLGCSQAKGEILSDNLHAISSSMVKVSERSPTLVCEGEGVSGVSQGEPLMQEKSGEKEGT